MRVMPFRTVLSALDFSEASYKALQSAIELAVHFRANVVLVHVISDTPPTAADAAYVLDGREGYEQDQKQAAEQQLSLIRHAMLPNIQSRSVILQGDAAKEIVRVAAEEEADVIVIATHGTSGWRHLVFGSVAEKVVRHADRPVLVIPAQDSPQSTT
jgi:nucleotide-binding universal stress UspA family protein